MQTEYYVLVVREKFDIYEKGEFVFFFPNDSFPYSTSLLSSACFFKTVKDAEFHLKDGPFEIKTVTMTLGDLPDPTKRATQKLADIHS